MPIPISTIAVIVASSLCWSALDALRKRLTTRLSALPLATLLTAGQLPLFLVWLLASESPWPSPGYLRFGAAGVAINLIALVLFLRALSRSPISLMIPLLSFTPAFASVLSALVLGEFPGRLQQSGIGLTVVGALSLHLGGGAVTLRGAWRALRHEPGTPAMLAVAGLWALGAALDKGALGYATAPAHASIQCAAITALLLAALAARGRLAELRAVAAVAGPYAAAVCVACLGLGLQLLALQLALVSVVETVKRALGMALAVASGRLFFGERVTPGKLAGILLLAVGVALTLG